MPISEKFENVSVKLKANVYFDGKVISHSIFLQNGTKKTVGLIYPGAFKFNTDAPERMDIIAGNCRFTLEWRPVPGQPPTHLLDLLNQAIAAEKKSDPDFACEVNPGRIDRGFDTASDSSLVGLLQKLSGREAGTIAFGTEAPQLIELGAEAVVFGPGDIRAAHRTGEFVAIEELHRCVAVLTNTIERCCQGFSL